MQRGMTRDDKKQAMIDELHRLADLVGHPPTEQEMKQYGEYNVAEYRGGELFRGVWVDAIKDAGLDPDELPDDYLLTEEERLEDLASLVVKDRQESRDSPPKGVGEDEDSLFTKAEFEELERLSDQIIEDVHRNQEESDTESV